MEESSLYVESLTERSLECTIHTFLRMKVVTVKFHWRDSKSDEAFIPCTSAQLMATDEQSSLPIWWQQAHILQPGTLSRRFPPGRTTVISASIILPYLLRFLCSHSFSCQTYFHRYRFARIASPSLSASSSWIDWFHSVITSYSYQEWFQYWSLVVRTALCLQRR